MKEILVNLSQALGLAYWVKIETETPQCTYYFGPFLTEKGAKESQVGYVEDLKQEGASTIYVSVDRFNPKELTIYDEVEETTDFKPVPIFGSHPF